MPLEQDLQALTSAIISLTNALNNCPDVPSVLNEPTEVKKSEKPVTTVKTKVVADTSSTVTEPEPEVVEEADLTGGEPEEIVTLKMLATKFTDLVEHDRPAAVTLLKEYGIAKISLANTDLYAELYDKTVGLLNG
ncbi:MAG TPA: hypothetical protein VIM16_05795 [Mucilaginibacter sp.]|jgi:hypothetical protein